MQHFILQKQRRTKKITIYASNIFYAFDHNHRKINYKQLKEEGIKSKN